MKRISTASFAGRAAQRLEGGEKLVDALQRPMVSEVLEVLDGPRPLKCMLIGPYQTLKSAVGQLHLARNIVVNPGPYLWYQPTDLASQKFADLKLNPFLEAQWSINGLAYANRNKLTKLKKMLAGPTSLMLLSAGTEADRHSVTARDIYIDEIHQIEEPGAIAQIRNRHGDYPNDHLEFMMSTGLIAGTEAHTEWQTTDQRTWHCKCPLCDAFFEPRYAYYSDDGQGIVAGLRYEKHFLENGLPNERAIATSLHYECPHCHGKLMDNDATRLAMSGTAKNPKGKYVAMNASSQLNAVGFTFHAIAVRPWLGIVMRFERAHLARKRGDMSELAKCIMEEFAGIWDPELYLKRVVSRPVAAYKLGDDWEYEDRANPLGSRFCNIDVQQDYYILTIRMWGRASASRLRWCARPKSITEIRDILKAHSVEDRHVFMDSRHDSTRIRRIAALNNWNTMQGDGRTDGTAPKSYLHEDGLRRIYEEEPKILDAHIGTLAEGQGSNAMEWLFSKQSALDRLHLLRTETYCPNPLLPDHTEPLHACASDTPEWYWKQAFAHRRKSLTHKDGSLTQIWFGSHDDHSEDCECMGVVVATMAGLTGAESLAPAVETQPS